MALELSHGKVRPTLPRASDLEPSDTVAKPSDARTPDGRFAAGNRTAVAARFTHTIRKALGSSESTGVALIVARDARRVFGSVLRSLPSEAPPVRALLAVYARHQALHGYYTLRAEALGLDSEAGLALLAVADRQSQRAERVLVTCHDLARLHSELDAKRIDESTVPVGFIDDDGPTAAPAPGDEPPGADDSADDEGSET